MGKTFCMILSCAALSWGERLTYQYCCKKQVHWKHWIPQWRTGRGRCAHLCSGTCCHVSSTTSDHLHCMHLWESRNWSYKVTEVNHFLFPFLGRGGHSSNLGKPQRDIFSHQFVSCHGKSLPRAFSILFQVQPSPVPCQQLPAEAGVKKQMFHSNTSTPFNFSNNSNIDILFYF